MKVAKLVHIMTPTVQLMGYTRQSQHDPVILLTEAVLITYPRDRQGRMLRNMRSIASDDDYTSGQVTVRGDAVIIEVAEREEEGALYKQYMDALHPGRIQQVENKIVAPGGAAVN